MAHVLHWRRQVQARDRRQLTRWSNFGSSRRMHGSPRRLCEVIICQYNILFPWTRCPTCEENILWDFQAEINHSKLRTSMTDGQRCMPHSKCCSVANLWQVVLASDSISAIEITYLIRQWSITCKPQRIQSERNISIQKEYCTSSCEFPFPKVLHFFVDGEDILVKEEHCWHQRIASIVLSEVG